MHAVAVVYSTETIIITYDTHSEREITTTVRLPNTSFVLHSVSQYANLNDLHLIIAIPCTRLIDLPEDKDISN